MKRFAAALKNISSRHPPVKSHADVVISPADEVYQLPQLHPRPFMMTADLERRKVIEESRKKCGVMPQKFGVYL